MTSKSLKFLRFITIFLALWYLNPTPAQASFLDACRWARELSINVFGLSAKIELSPQELSRWQKILDINSDLIGAPPRAINNESIETSVIWWRYEQLPAEIKQHLLEQSGRSQFIFTNYLFQLSRVLHPNTSQHSLLRALQSAWSNYLSRYMFKDSPPLDYKSWVQKNVDQLNELKHESTNFETQLAATHQRLLLETRAEIWWQQHLDIKFKYQHLGGSNYQVEIGSTVYKAKLVSKNTLAIQDVPKDRLHIPAWNPLETKKMKRVISQGLTNQKTFGADIGLDGEFWLFDGNHRFAVSNRKTYTVKVGFPPHTMSLNNFTQYLGAVGLKQEVIHDLYSGKKNIKDVLSPQILRRLFLVDLSAQAAITPENEPLKN